MTVEQVNSIVNNAFGYAPQLLYLSQGASMEGQVLTDSFTLDIRTKAEKINPYAPAIKASVFVSVVLIGLALTKFAS